MREDFLKEMNQERDSTYLEIEDMKGFEMNDDTVSRHDPHNEITLASHQSLHRWFQFVD